MKQINTLKFFEKVNEVIKYLILFFSLFILATCGLLIYDAFSIKEQGFAVDFVVNAIYILIVLVFCFKPNGSVSKRTTYIMIFLSLMNIYSLYFEFFYNGGAIAFAFPNGILEYYLLLASFILSIFITLFIFARYYILYIYDYFENQQIMQFSSKDLSLSYKYFNIRTENQILIIFIIMFGFCGLNQLFDAISYYINSIELYVSIGMGIFFILLFIVVFILNSKYRNHHKIRLYRIIASSIILLISIIGLILSCINVIGFGFSLYYLIIYFIFSFLLLGVCINNYFIK